MMRELTYAKSPVNRLRRLPLRGADQDQPQRRHQIVTVNYRGESPMWVDGGHCRQLAVISRDGPAARRQGIGVTRLHRSRVTLACRRSPSRVSKAAQLSGLPPDGDQPEHLAVLKALRTSG
jgi:hypothetical protein